MNQCCQRLLHAKITQVFEEGTVEDCHGIQRPRDIGCHWLPFQLCHLLLQQSYTDLLHPGGWPRVSLTLHFLCGYVLYQGL